MRIVVVAVGRMKAGPERELLDRYLSRAKALGRGLGIPAIDVVEVDESRARSPEERRREESAAVLGRIAPGWSVVALDERGSSAPSEVFAARIGRLADEGAPALVFAIGGADGHGEALRARAGELASFGSATLPHQLVRVVLAEQIYRAFTILAHHPYHRA